MNKPMSDQEALDFAVAASCLKHSIPGDINLSTVEEVNQLLADGGSGRISR
jgi:2-dehydro-3-deoxygluconokinase